MPTSTSSEDIQGSGDTAPPRDRPPLNRVVERRILEELLEAPTGISQTHLVRRVKASGGTVSTSIRRLVELGLIDEFFKRASKRGRPKRHLILAARAGLVVGVHCGKREITFVLGDLYGGVPRRPGQEQDPFQPTALSVTRRRAGPHGNQWKGSWVGEAVGELLSASALEGRKPRVIGAGVSVASEGELRIASKVARSLESRSRYHLPAPVFTESEAGLCDYVRTHFKDRFRDTHSSQNPWVYVRWGERIGCAMWIDGKFAAPASPRNENFSHLRSPSLNDETCDVCGRACLQSNVTPLAISRRLGIDEESLLSDLGENADVSVAVTDALVELAAVGSPLIATMDPERIILATRWSRHAPDSDTVAEFLTSAFDRGLRESLAGEPRGGFRGTEVEWLTPEAAARGAASAWLEHRSFAALVRHLKECRRREVQT